MAIIATFRGGHDATGLCMVPPVAVDAEIISIVREMYRCEGERGVFGLARFYEWGDMASLN